MGRDSKRKKRSRSRSSSRDRSKRSGSRERHKERKRFRSKSPEKGKDKSSRKPRERERDRKRKRSESASSSSSRSRSRSPSNKKDKESQRKRKSHSRSLEKKRKERPRSRDRDKDRKRHSKSRNQSNSSGSRSKSRSPDRDHRKSKSSRDKRRRDDDESSDRSKDSKKSKEVLRTTMEYSSEELNYFRMCRIVIKLVPEGLRKVFKQKWDFLYSTSPGGPWQDTAQNGKDFYLMEIMGEKSEMYSCFLNDVRNGNSAKWDGSCLISAILYSDTIGSTLGASIHTAVNDLRKVRNDIVHPDNDELTDHDFQSYARRVVNAFRTLGLPITAVEDVKNQKDFPIGEVKALKKSINDLKIKLHQRETDLSNVKDTNNALTTKLDQVKSELDARTSILQRTQDDLSAAKEENNALAQEIDSKIESFCSLTLAQSHEIIRRDGDIQRIAEKMQELHNRSNGAVSTIYLSGNPGCGKSQLARQIGDDFLRLKSRGTDGHALVATLNAETLKTLVDSYITLAKRLNITKFALGRIERSKTANPEETIGQVMRIISFKFENWLIIMDNVVNLLLVREHLPQTASKEWGHGQVLIITQDSGVIPSNAPLTYHESLSRGMQPDDAVELLKQVSQVADQQDVELVVETLEYQPLALAAAACYVQRVSRGGSLKYNWADYLKQLKSFLRRES